MNRRASHPAAHYALPAIAKATLFFGGPMLCFVRLLGWRSYTYVLTWPAPWEMLAAVVAGAAIGSWLSWSLPFQGKLRSTRRYLLMALIAFGWSMMGVYWLCWYVEMAAFAGSPVKETPIEAPVVAKHHSGRGNAWHWINVRTEYGANAPINVPRSLYDRVDPSPGNQCLILRIETGRNRVVRVRLDPPPELVVCSTGAKAAS